MSAERKDQSNPEPAGEPQTDAVGEAKAWTDRPYEIGYKRPPAAYQFKPNESGNRNGRPKGSKNWSTIMNAAASRRRTIGVGGKKVRMSGREAIAEQLVINAIKGDKAARRDFLNEMKTQRHDAPTASPSPAPEPLSAHDEALLADFFARASKRFEGGER